ncbi:hypothetical protein [Mesorhizobium sp. B3-1-7]|nr:hypothetical protein [Mesorhizobium sp. B3-1-7]
MTLTTVFDPIRVCRPEGVDFREAATAAIACAVAHLALNRQPAERFSCP